ncbi:hypothetical protein [Flavilitoribacter nigricans]|nr:hypothetical protein [Flavilitoribacter nigricans]
MASVSSNITGVLSGANQSMVKLTGGDIVSLAEYQELFDAAEEGEEPQIAGILTGSDEGMVQLADGRIISTAQYVREIQAAEEGKEPVAKKVLQGSYADNVQTASGLNSLAELYRVPDSPPS